MFASKAKNQNMRSSWNVTDTGHASNNLQTSTSIFVFYFTTWKGFKLCIRLAFSWRSLGIFISPSFVNWTWDFNSRKWKQTFDRSLRFNRRKKSILAVSLKFLHEYVKTAAVLLLTVCVQVVKSRVWQESKVKWTKTSPINSYNSQKCVKIFPFIHELDNSRQYIISQLLKRSSSCCKKTFYISNAFLGVSWPICPNLMKKSKNLYEWAVFIFSIS